MLPQYYDHLKTELGFMEDAATHHITLRLPRLAAIGVGDGGGGGSRTRVRNYLAKRIYVCIRFLFGFAARH